MSSLRANRLRSLLTLLGIVVGVMAVIAVVSIISGLNDYVAGKIFNLGPDVITVTRMSPVITSLDEFIESQKRKNLYLSDMAAIRAACAECRAVGASVNARSRVKFGRDYLDSEIRGLTAETPAIRGYELQAGRFLTFGLAIGAFGLVWLVLWAITRLVERHRALHPPPPRPVQRRPRWKL